MQTVASPLNAPRPALNRYSVEYIYETINWYYQSNFFPWL